MEHTRAGLILQRIGESRYDDVEAALSDLDSALEILGELDVTISDCVYSPVILANSKGSDSITLSIYSDPPMSGSDDDQFLPIAKGSMSIDSIGKDNMGSFSFDLTKIANADPTIKVVTDEMLKMLNDDHEFAKGADYGQGDESDERSFDQDELEESLNDAVREIGHGLISIIKKHFK